MSHLNSNILLRRATDLTTIFAYPASSPMVRTSRSWFVAGSDRQSVFVNADYGGNFAASSYDRFTVG